MPVWSSGGWSSITPWPGWPWSAASGSDRKPLWAGVDADAGGVRVTLDSGEVLHARAVVGADGVTGPTRRSSGLPKPELRAQVVEVDTERVQADPAQDVIQFDFAERELDGYTWSFPTLVNGSPMVCRGAYVLLGRGSGSARAHLDRYLARRGLDMSRYRLKPFAEHGFSPDAAISRPRVLLVGEAAGIDIATGEGIPQAIAYGALAGAYLAESFRMGTFQYRDWYEHVHASPFGRRLQWRHKGFQAFYGPERDTLERITLRAPALVRAGLQDFAGQGMHPMTVLRGLLQAAPQAVAGGRTLLKVASLILNTTLES